MSAEGRFPFGSMKDANNARLNLPSDSDWFSPIVMEQYFKQLYFNTNTFDKKDIKHYLYKPNELCFEKASSFFKLIDDDGVNVIVNWGASMELVEELKQSGGAYP